MVKDMKLEKVSVIIPAYKPDEKLIATLQELSEHGFDDILVVNDGSGEDFAGIFARVEALSNCTVLVHEVNRGKGAALKTAFAYFLEHRPHKACVVTADADGQHLTKDIAAVSCTALEMESVVLGVRDFSGENVPPKSKAGNRITCGVFRLFFGMKIQDTQTGLRAFPKRYLAEILAAEGERYEYETNMLFLMNRKKIPFEQVEIETVYLDENKSSHFRVVRDSLRVYALIIKYLLSSVSGAVIDECAFYIFKKVAFLAFIPIPLTFTAAILARVISSFANYLMNAKMVFGDKVNKKALAKYYTLAVAQISLSAVLVFVVEHLLSITSPGLSTLVKGVIDTVLFFFSFRIQHKWVFNNSNND